MPLSSIIAGAGIDIAKKYLFKNGEKAAHDFVDSATGKNLGIIIDYRKQDGNNNLLLFVHGFSGNSAETFGCTPDMLIADKIFEGWDIFSIGYSSDIFPSIGKGLWSVNPDITKIGLYLNTLLSNQFDSYSRIAFVVHSMGGLAVQRAILDAQNDVLQKISHVIFFGTPSAGLRKAYWLRFWSTQIRDLSSESDFIKKLRKDWAERFNGNMNFVFKTIAGNNDEFVPIESSLQPFDKKYWGSIEGNHITMIKPKDINDLNQQSLGIILKTLTGQHIDDLHGNPGEINILLGHYQVIINKYFPVAKEIALGPLADLVFALECMDRKDDALKVLEEHPKASSDSDTLGIIGGRYKRRYLLNGLQNDLDKAFEYYKNALSISQQNNAKRQVFYHAVNLAFLSIINRDENDMKKYAQTALDNCNPSSDYIWEIATIAESNLYLGNMDIAEKSYKQAATEPGIDARCKASIYSNAYYGYMALTANRNKNDAFIKMLGDTFLN